MSFFETRTLEGLLRTIKPAGDAVRTVELQQEMISDSYRLVLQIGDVCFYARIAGIDIERSSGSAEDVRDVVCKPLFALDRLWKDGIAEGRKRERTDEITRLRDIRETALRMRTSRAYAAGWNAVAAALTPTKNVSK